MRESLSLSFVTLALLFSCSDNVRSSEELFRVSSSKAWGGVDIYIELSSVQRDGDIVSMSLIDDFKKRRHVGIPHRSTKIYGSVNCKGILLERHAYETYDDHFATGAKLESRFFPEPKKWKRPSSEEEVAIFNKLCGTSILLEGEPQKRPVFYPKNVTPKSINITVTPNDEGPRVFSVMVDYKFNQTHKLSNGKTFNESIVSFDVDCEIDETWNEHRSDSRSDIPNGIYSFTETNQSFYSDEGWSTWGPDKAIKAAVNLVCQ